MNIPSKVTTGLAATAMVLISQGAAMADPIKIAINEWTGQHISAHFAGALFKELGHDVEFITAGAVPQIAALAEGSLHFQPELWTNNVGDIYPKAIESGDIKVVGGLGLEPQEGWIYPPYMEEMCPGLPAYEALYDCAQAFAAADTFPNGRLITYPADWGTRSADLVELIDLPFKPVPGGSEGAMLAELKSAVTAKQPILMMMWQPHWVFAETEVNWVQWDTPHGDCDEANQKRGEACGFQQASVEKIVSKGFAETYPDAMKLVEQMSLSNEVQNALILEVDQKGREVEEVVAEWMSANADVWQPWIAAAK
ncbi:ABC transporter substrate-binding protein [Shimia sp. CNT1-13L.2]|jgi:glycine betaine/proline transport system substrate-binding protein|uniref:ABC transporter substrate-binding protein n=1 Tax=Shimia sp. CNT1-13L.2 TaxID=2959663 RepID=UPI0020CD6F92|nr:ABC transporter substrate-binding protein [Shimia sp. CNT1-13L.2]MCP9483397.1 ABC transporter substrate-binding protein [Shimia sp. CNT1-13L.2]